MFQFSTITLLNSLTDKSGQSLFNKEDNTLLFKGEGLYQVDEDHLIEIFKNEGHKEYRDIVDITNLEEMISDPTKIYRIEFYIESNANADPLFSNSLSRKSKTVFVEFNSIDSFYVNLNRFQTMTYGSQLLNLVGELDGEIADGKSTVTSANKTNQNNYLMASNCYIRVMKAEIQEADNFGKFYSIGNLDIYHGSEGLGTQEDILKNYILPTGYNNRLSQILTTDQPLNGALYDQFIIRYFVNRGNLGIHAVGQQTITETLHCFWINQNESQEFEQTITQLINSKGGSNKGPKMLGLYYNEDIDQFDFCDYYLGDPIEIQNGKPKPLYFILNEEQKNKLTRVFGRISGDIYDTDNDSKSLEDMVIIIDQEFINSNDAHSSLENYIGYYLCNIPYLATELVSNEIEYLKYTYDGIEYNVTYLSTQITATFNVTSDSEKTPLYFYYAEEGKEEYWVRGVDIFDKVEIDGTEVPATSLDEAKGMYQLSVGEHTVEYTLKDPTSISSGAFNSCRNISSVTIPNSVTTIEDGAFRNCSGSITIPSSVTIIGNEAFYDCTGELIVNCNIPDRAFQNCDQITSVKLGDNITSIGASAFEGCRGLENSTMIIPESVTQIGADAFSFCYGLNTVFESPTPPIINDDIFYYTDGNIYVKSDSVNAYKTANIWSSYADRIKAIPTFCKLTLNDGSEIELEGNGELTRIMIEKYQSTLVNAEIGELCTNIGQSAFNSFNRLSSVTIPNSVTVIGIRAFESCSSLTSINISNGVTSICDNAFGNCSSITNITIPNSITSIGNHAFFNCTAMTTCTIGNDSLLTSIGLQAFNNCSSLTNINIPNGVTSISDSTFYNCSSLTNVIITNSVTGISNYAFEGCSSLISITVEAITPPILGDGAFGNTNDCPIYVPAASVDTYKTTWSTYADRIQAIQE